MIPTFFQAAGHLRPRGARAGLNRVGDNYMDFYSVVDLLNVLDEYGALVVESRTENTMTIRVDKEGILKLGQDQSDFILKCIHKGPTVAVEELYSRLSKMLGNNVILRTNREEADTLRANNLRANDPTFCSTGEFYFNG